MKAPEELHDIPAGQGSEAGAGGFAGGAGASGAAAAQTIPGPLVRDVTDDTFAQLLELSQTVPFILDMWAPWCGPCRMFSSTVDSVAEERNDIKVGKINIDENIDLANQFGVASIPTLVLVQDGRKKASSIGLRSKKDVLKMLDA